MILLISLVAAFGLTFTMGLFFVWRELRLIRLDREWLFQHKRPKTRSLI